MFGRVPVVDEDGPAITRSAAGRLAVETAAWLPQALTPQSGALWRPVDERRAAVSLPGIVDQPDVEVTVDDDGRLLSVRVERWNASTKPPGLDAFGGPIESELWLKSGVRIAGRGAGGWGWGTETWPAGCFFEYSISAV